MNGMEVNMPHISKIEEHHGNCYCQLWFPSYQKFPSFELPHTPAKNIFRILRRYNFRFLASNSSVEGNSGKRQNFWPQQR